MPNLSSGPSPSDNVGSTAPPIDPKLRRRMLARLAWMRAGLGALAGALAGFLNFLSLDVTNPNSNAYYGAYIALFVYIISYYLAKNVLGMNLPPSDKNKLITQGIGSYIMLFLFVWIVYNSLCSIGLCVTYQGIP